MHPCNGGSTDISPTQHGPPPVPYLWAPKYIPENWVYTDGFIIDGYPRLGASVVHILSTTTIYIDVAGTEETRTIMRAELVAIRMALATFAAHELVGVFTDFLSSLQAIEHHNTNPIIGDAKHYHHHMLLIESIIELLDTKASLGFRTTLYKIRGHTHIRGNDLADATAKLAVRSFETLPHAQTFRVDVRENAPRPKHWVMHTANPTTLTTSLATSNSCPTTHRSWWSIPEAERLQMHAFPRPSQQLRLKVRHALLRSNHHTSFYRRLVVANKGMGARLHTMGQSIHKRLNSVPKEGTTLLEFMYGQLYTGNLAKRYEHATTD